jgi:VP3 protein
MMEGLHYNDSNSISRVVMRRLKECSFTMTFKALPDKKYSSVSDFLFYSLGDAFENSLKHQPLYYSNDEQKAGLISLGFVDPDDEDVNMPSHSANVRKLCKSPLIKFIIGVEPNTLKMTSTLKSIPYDAFQYSCYRNHFDTFKMHCMKRWGMVIPESYEVAYDQYLSYINVNYKVMFLPVITNGPQGEGDSFAKCSTGFTDISLSVADDHVRIKNGSVTGSQHTIFAPALGEVQGDGRLKNKSATSGLMRRHDKFILIGDSPGDHYKAYKYLTPDNCISFDPRRPKYHRQTTWYEQFFTSKDIPKLVQIIGDWPAEDNVLVRIDIRRDKMNGRVVTDYERSIGVDRGIDAEDEMNVHEDNKLMAEIINTLGSFKNVTISCKLRPVYTKFSNPDDASLHYDYEVVYFPLPYLAPSTVEFNLVKFRDGLGSGVWFDDRHINHSLISYFRKIDYDMLILEGNSFVTMKKLFGPLYNMFLSDLMLYLGVDLQRTSILSNSACLYSLSNAYNPTPDIMLGKAQSTSVTQFIITYPYAMYGDEDLELSYRARRYNDHYVNVSHEIAFPDYWFFPTTALDSAKGLTFTDLTNVIVTDIESVVLFTQPDGIISTQYVKLVSSMLKNTFPDFNKLDDESRANTIRAAADIGEVIPTFNGFMHDAKGDHTINGFMHKGHYGTVSGHMLYVVLGSLLGLPYGLNKYLREIEMNELV